MCSDRDSKAFSSTQLPATQHRASTTTNIYMYTTRLDILCANRSLGRNLASEWRIFPILCSTRLLVFLLRRLLPGQRAIYVRDTQHVVKAHYKQIITATSDIPSTISSYVSISVRNRWVMGRLAQYHNWLVQRVHIRFITAHVTSALLHCHCQPIRLRFRSRLKPKPISSTNHSHHKSRP